MGKTIFITGASKGIGRETALIFAEKGYNIIIGYNTDEKEAKLIEEQGAKLGIHTRALQIDIRDNESILKAVQTIGEEYEQIDCLINNAGVIAWKPLVEQTDEEIEDQINTNLIGIIKLTKAMIPYIKDTVINIASGAGKQGYSTLTTYCATKFGIRGFTKALAKETKLKVFVVNPGMTATQMTNFSGVPPREVAEVIFNTYEGRYKKESGADIDVSEYIS